MKSQRLAVLLFLLAGCRGQHQGPGEIKGAAVPAPVIAARQSAQTAALQGLAPGAPPAKQILFGDLHVHTTFSPDAFMRSLPFLHGEGTHPPADACDFARYCSDLDFWSINDHAEGISPEHWKETKESIRQCNAVAGDPKNPDLVAFLGWEWTQVGQTPKDHYGHKNVIFKETDEDKVPKRPISALSAQLVGALRSSPPLWQRLQLPIFDFSNRQRYFDVAKYQEELRETPMCPEGVDTRELPDELPRVGADAGGAVREAVPVGVRHDRHPARHHVGPVHAARQRLGQAARRRHARPREADADRGLFRPRQLRGVPQLARRRLRRQGRSGLPGADRRLPAVLLAGGRDHPRALRRHAGRRVRAARRDGAPQLPRRRRRRAVTRSPAATIEEWKDCGYCRDCFNPAVQLAAR